MKGRYWKSHDPTERGATKKLEFEAPKVRFPHFDPSNVQASETPVPLARIRLTQGFKDVEGYNEYEVFYIGAATYIQRITPETSKQRTTPDSGEEVSYSDIAVVSIPCVQEGAGSQNERRLAAAIKHLAALSTVPVLESSESRN